MPLDAGGDPPGFPRGQGGHAFRIPVAQADKIRARDDLKYGCVNSSYAEKRAISLPTGGHIGGMFARISDAGKSWPSLKWVANPLTRTFR